VNGPAAADVHGSASAKGEFVFMTIKNAGHMVPTFKRPQSFAMYQRFISGNRSYDRA
jgi:carboxypeptidase C (cathepsin A)